MAVALYSPEDVIIMLGGVIQLEGLSSGTFISIERDEACWEVVTTSDGYVRRTKLPSKTHTLTLTLSSTADDNILLTKMLSLDNMLSGVTVPIMIKDTSGNSMFYASSCWVEAEAPTVYSEGVEGREWKIRTAGGVNVIAGNESGEFLSGEIASILSVLG